MIPPSIATYSDFLNDLREHFIDSLAIMDARIATPLSADVMAVGVQYFSENLRRIQKRSRHVIWSRELTARALALPSAVQLALLAIEASSIAGESLNSRLSNTIFNASFHDLLLHEWGIHHLHLGAPDTDSDLPVVRGDKLLFVWVTPDAVYFIDVLGHKVGDEPTWARDELIDIVHTNWPNLLEPYRCRYTYIPESQRLSPKSRQEFRRAGGIVLTQAKDGTVYLAPGGGYASDGTSARARDFAAHWLNKASQWQQWCKRNANAVVCWISQETGKTLNELRLKALVSGDVLVIEETQTCFRFPCNNDTAKLVSSQENGVSN